MLLLPSDRALHLCAGTTQVLGAPQLLLPGKETLRSPQPGQGVLLSLPSCKVLMQSHPTGMFLHCLSQHAPISDDSQLSLGAGLMASMRRWRMQAQTLQPPKMICGRRTTLQQASSCHRTAAPARSCAAACAASRTSWPTPGALGAAR